MHSVLLTVQIALQNCGMSPLLVTITSFCSDNCNILVRSLPSLVLLFFVEPTSSLLLQVCKEAEITEICKQSKEMLRTEYLTAVQKDMTGDFTTKLPDKKK